MNTKTNEILKFASKAVVTFVYCLTGHTYGLILTLYYDDVGKKGKNVTQKFTTVIVA